MYRPRHLVRTHGALFWGRGGWVGRFYTPIYTPEAPSDPVGALSTTDECRTLWASAIPVPTVERAVELWLRYGNDPVAHTAVPRETALSAAGAPSATSPFAYIEDYMGTNLVTGSTAHVKESAELWASFFEKKYTGRMRRSRRTSQQFVGLLASSSSATGAGQDHRSGGAAIFSDEADNPNTKWEADTFFREMAYLAERHLKAKTTNHLQLTRSLWLQADVDAFLAFFDAFQQETVIRVPLPVPSIWLYEGEGRKRWAERYLPALRAAHQFFDTKMSQAASKGDAALLGKIAAAYKAVHAVLLERHERQIKAGISPSFPFGSIATAAEESWSSNEVEREHRRIEEGVFDAEDLLDTTPEWTAEHDRIAALLAAKIDGTDFSLNEVWLHTTRLDLLETIHVLEKDCLARVQSSVRTRLYQEDALVDIYAAIEESVAKGQLDMRAAVLRPHFNTIWCKLNYVRFGAASIVHHTHTASRQLQFHFAPTTREVAAAAQLSYATKPLSSQVDYTSPYTYRRSIAHLCSRYGTDMTHAAQRPLLLSAAHLAKAEEVIRRVSDDAARPYGVQRRARYTAAAASQQRLLQPITDVTVSAVDPELLEAGADVEALLQGGSSSQRATAAAPVTVCPCGSRQQVHYRWAVPSLDKLRRRQQSSRLLTVDAAAELKELRESCRIEISLWRRRTAAERQSAAQQQKREASEVAAAVEAMPPLAEVQQYAVKLHGYLAKEAAVDCATPAVENEEWVFCVMLDDAVPLSERESAVVYIPYQDTKGAQLPPGEYRICVRGYDRALNPTEHPTLRSEACSAVFNVVDALPQLYAQFSLHNGSSSTAGAAAAEEVAGVERPLSGDLPGGDFTAFCSFLRDAGLDVPLQFEFQMGQSLDKEGNISLEEFTAKLRGADFHCSLCENGLTDAQRSIEEACRAHWTLYHPGATEEEWAVARRRVLNHAMARERDWWLPDSILNDGDVETGSSASGSVSFEAYPAAKRYGTELCTILPAEGSSYAHPAFLPPAPGVKGSNSVQADCTVDGTGAIVSLHYGAPVSEAEVSVEAALQAAMEAVQHAQSRHCTLSMMKLGHFEKLSQASTFCDTSNLDFGGKYARTYGYALEKAKRDITEAVEGGVVSSTWVSELEKARVSEQEQVDRFASQTHPEQRNTRFAPRVRTDGYNMEDPSPDQTSTWGV